MPIKIGFITENLYDTESLTIFLLKINYEDFKFIHLNKGFNGSSIETEKALRNIKFEFEKENPRLVIVVRDYDSQSKGKRYSKWFDTINFELNNKAIFLQIIYEIETLIITDIQPFNKIFHTKLKQIKKPLTIRDPKQYLIDATKKQHFQYYESDNPEIFQNIDHNKILQISYIKNFISDFNKRIEIECNS